MSDVGQADTCMRVDRVQHACGGDSIQKVCRKRVYHAFEGLNVIGAPCADASQHTVAMSMKSDALQHTTYRHYIQKNHPSW